MTTNTEPWLTLTSPLATKAITVRPLHPEDADQIDAMHERLSNSSLYFRYLQFRKPSPAEIDAVCQLDPAKGAGFVAEQAEPPAIVGLAYYVREPQESDPTAEAGILVEDEFQEQGIGRTLWQHLHQQAQVDGIRRLRVLSHPSNQKMARLVKNSGFPYAAKGYAGVSEYVVSLGA